MQKKKNLCSKRSLYIYKERKQFFFSLFFCHGRTDSQNTLILLVIIVCTCRLGIVVDFLSHSTITGFMGGTATIICLQQLKGMFGLKHFTTKTDVVSVLHSIITHRNEVVAQNSHSSLSSSLSILVFFLFSIFPTVRNVRTPRPILIPGLVKGVSSMPRVGNPQEITLFAASPQ